MNMIKADEAFCLRVATLEQCATNIHSLENVIRGKRHPTLTLQVPYDSSTI